MATTSREDLFAADELFFSCRSAGCLRLGRARVRPHVRDEPKAPAVNGLDDPLTVAVVSEGSTHLADRARQGRVCDGHVTPNVIEELLTSDDPVAMPHQVEEDVENLRLNKDGLASAPEL